jgi:hypothetical protein
VSKKQFYICFIVVICMFMTSAMISPAMADLKSQPLNVNPTTGLYNIPIADVVGKNQIVLGYHLAKDEDGNDDESGVVLAGPSRQLELAILATEHDAFTANAQYLLYAKSSYSMAIGLQNVSLQSSDTRPVKEHIGDLAGYLVMTVPVSNSGLRLHLGAGTGRFDGIFGGADLTLAKSLQLMGEWDGQEKNAALRWTVLRGKHGIDQYELRVVGALIDLSESAFGVEVVLKQ